MRSDVRVGLFVLALALGQPGVVFANPCSDGGSLWPAPGPEDEGGIGGTGLTAPPDGGLGGTGHAPDPQGGLGGTGVQDSTQAGEGGIGGTGAEAAAVGHDREGGIGGTGVESTAAATGIFGTVSGFASICVGGIEVHVDAVSRVLIDGKAATASSLALGDVVEVVALGSGDAVRAVEVRSEALAVGPVTAVDAAAGRLEVAGQRVGLAPSTWSTDGPAAADGFATGDWVRVGGLRRPDGSIDASRLEPTASREVVLRGGISRDGDGLVLDGTPLEFAADAPAMEEGTGTVRGRWNGTAIEVDAVVVEAPLGRTSGISRLDVEGYLAHEPGEGRARVGGIPVEAAPALLGQYAAQRVRIVGSVDPVRGVRVESITPSRPRFAVPRPPRPAGARVSGAGQVPELRQAPPAARPPDARHHGAPDARIVRPVPLPPRGVHVAKPPRPPQVHRAPPVVVRPPRPPRPPSGRP
jgi:hypothetical protein